MTRLKGIWKNLLTAILVPAAFFLVVEGVLALSGVEPVRYEDDPYVGFSASFPLFVEDAGSGRMITAPNKRRLFNAQSFPRDKPNGAYRIFCLGGSTTHGRPYGDSTSFCGWLRALLAAVEPDRRWEVVNAGGVSYASYRSAELMEELLEYEPDLFIVYSGHNEFLERRTYSGLIRTPAPVRGLTALLGRTRLWAFGQGVLDRLADDPDQNDGAGEGSTTLNPEVTTLLDGSIGPDAYARDPELRQQIVEHYRFNLGRMVDIGRSVGAETILITPAGNLRSSTPFKSQHREGLEASELDRWEALVAEAESLSEAGDPAAALAVLERAAEIDELWAHLHFERGRLLHQLGRSGEARGAFERAREEDVCPLRALQEIIDSVREVGREWDVPVVDFVSLADRLAPDRLPGEELFFDHVHPKVQVHRALALELMAVLRDEGVLDRDASWTQQLVAGVTQEVEETLDPVAHGVALLNLSKVLGWAGKIEEAGRLAVLATQRAPELAEAHYQAGLCAQLQGHLEPAIGHYRRALELAPDVATAHSNLAAALEERGSTLQAILHYRRAVELLPDGPYRAQLIATLNRLGATSED